MGKLPQHQVKLPPFDFEAVAKDKGYLKARLILKQYTAENKQKEIDYADLNDPLLSIRNRLKAKNDLKVSRTVGLISSESHIERILELNNRDKNTIRTNHNRENDRSSTSNSSNSSGGSTQVAVIEDKESSATAYHQALISTEGSLFLSQGGSDYLPVGFGDTIALQSSFLRSMHCPGNNFKYITSHQIPQFSTYHMRHVRNLNLNNNKLKTFPNSIGNLHLLSVLDVAGNLLSSFPSSVYSLKQLIDLNISNNAFSSLPPEFSSLQSLTRLNLSNNALTAIPPCISKLLSLAHLDLSSNHILHLAIMPLNFIQPIDLWKKILNEEEGRFMYFHVLTKEKVYHISTYSGDGILTARDLHIFQPEGSVAYNRRRMWLSVNQIYEWEAVIDHGE